MIAPPRYEPTPKQREALWLLGLDPEHEPPGGKPLNEILYGGQAGGGKSALIRMAAFIVAERWPGSKVGVFRRTYPSLWDNHIAEFLKEAGEYGHFHAERHDYTLPNGSIIQFRAFDEEAKLIAKTSGVEWAAIFVDEATQFTGSMISWLRSRVRVPDQPNWYPICFYASNPGGEGHQYFKEQFVTPSKIQGGGVFLSPELPGVKRRYRRFFLPARLQDNPHLSAEDYGLALASIEDPQLRRAMRDGDWDLHAGRFFTEFDKRIHTCEPFDIPETWPKWRAVDWGYASPFVCLWFARDPTSPQRRTYVYRELVKRYIPTPYQARLILGMSYEDGPIRLTLADPSFFTRKHGAHVGATDAEHYAVNGVKLTKANNDRRAGWARLHHALYHGEEHGDPELLIMSHCSNLIQQFEDAQRSESDWNDIKDARHAEGHYRDDALDACRYGMMGASTAAKQGSSTLTRWSLQSETDQPPVRGRRRGH